MRAIALHCYTCALKRFPGQVILQKYQFGCKATHFFSFHQIFEAFFRKLKLVHNYAYRCIRTPKKYHQKSSNKSRKTILRGGKDPPSCRRVTFRPLKLLRNTLKVTRGHPQSYSRIVPKFTHPAALLFHSPS